MYKESQIHEEGLWPPVPKKKKLVPIIVFCDELPEWIIESDTAAYHPYTQTR